MVKDCSHISGVKPKAAPATLPTECNVPPKIKLLSSVESAKALSSKGKISIPKTPYKLITAIATPTSSLFLFKLGAKAAIADEPQMAVPKPTNHPTELGQFIFFAKKTVAIKTIKTVTPTIKKLSQPSLPMCV